MHFIFLRKLLHRSGGYVYAARFVRPNSDLLLTCGTHQIAAVTAVTMREKEHAESDIFRADLDVGCRNTVNHI